MALTFHPGDLDSSDVKALLELHFGMMRSISPPNACHVLPVDGLRDPAVTFWSARERGELVGVGALKELAADHGEVKSMRTHPDHLRKGVGRIILERIIEEARSRGCHRLSLETGSGEPFEAALSLYRKRGFVDGAAFGEYEKSAFNQFLHLDLTIARR